MAQLTKPKNIATTSPVKDSGGDKSKFLKLKVSPPTFSGKSREFAVFKRDFNTIVWENDYMESFVLMRAQETLSNVFIAFFTFILKFCIILLYFGLEFFFFSLGLSLISWVVVEITGL